MDFNAGIDGFCFQGLRRIRKAGTVVETALALPVQFYRRPTARVTGTNGSLKRHGIIAQIREFGPAQHLFIEKCHQRHVGRFTFIHATVINQGVHAKHVFLGIFPVIAIFAALGNIAHEFKRNITNQLPAGVCASIGRQRA